MPTYRRTALNRFTVGNNAYQNTPVTFYTVDLTTGERTSTLATLYDAQSGGNVVSNPYTLDSSGKTATPLYFEEPVVAVINSTSLGTHSSGIIYPLSGNWRGAWAASTAYQPGDMVSAGSGALPDIYVCTGSHTSSALFASDESSYWDLAINVNDVATQAAAAAASATAAAASAAAAATSETNAGTSASSAATSATNAATSETNAATSESNASTSATAAASSASAAATSAANAATSESNASTSATAAATSATNAATSATNASTSETNAASSASAASTSATNAATSESNASTSETNAASSASAASTSETNAATSETNASTSATNAATSETNAGTSATAAAASATAAAGSANAIGFSWDFDSATTMADPGTGEYRLNNATLSSVTAIAISASAGNTGNPDVSDFINTWDDSTSTVRGYLVIRNVTDSTDFAIYQITGSVTDNTTWLQATLSHVASSGTLTAADECIISFYRTGDSGSLIGIDGLTDVTITGTPADNELLAYDSGSGEWINQTMSEAGFGSLAALNTVNNGNWSGTDLTVANGGTGRSVHTAYAVLCGGTTTTGAQQSVAALGDSGDVLASAGAASLPAMQTPVYHDTQKIHNELAVQDYVIGYIDFTCTLESGALIAASGSGSVDLYLSSDTTSASGTAITGGAFTVSTTEDDNTFTGDNTVVAATPKYLVAKCTASTTLTDVITAIKYSKGVTA